MLASSCCTSPCDPVRLPPRCTSAPAQPGLRERTVPNKRKKRGNSVEFEPQPLARRRRRVQLASSARRSREADAALRELVDCIDPVVDPQGAISAMELGFHVGL